MFTLVFILQDAKALEPTQTRAQEITEKGITTRPVSVLHFHGDVLFTPDQRARVEAGLRDVEVASCGFVKTDVVWDMDSFAKYTMLHNNIIVWATTETVKRIKGPSGEYNLGLTVNFGVKWIFLVMPKMLNDLDVDRLEWVTAHEVTHAAGMMEHVQNGLMEPEAPWVILEKPTWENDDLDNFCKVWHCKREMFYGCRYR